MSDIRIIDFKIRSNYPNYKNTKFLIDNWGNSNPKKTPEGYLPPVIEYIDDKSNEANKITADFIDIHFLNQEDKANEYLQKLILSQKNDTEASSYINNLKNIFFEKKKPIYNNHQFVENEYVVPSCSTEKHDFELISHKGKALLELYQEGYPVPDFCILSSKAYFADKQTRLEAIKDTISNLEKMTGLKFGATKLPLIFALRCAMPSYIPGLMPTYLNVGVTKNNFQALKEQYGKLVALKIYYYNLKTIHDILYEVNEISKLTKERVVFSALELENKIMNYYEKISEIDEKILIDPYYQVLFFVERAYNFFELNGDLVRTFIRNKEYYPSIIFHKMVWTIRNDDSYPGVLYSRHSRTGLGMQIESVRNIFGEDIMTGIINTELTEFFDRQEIKEKFPAVYHFTPLLSKLEKILQSPATVEFAAETNHKSNYFAVLQLNMSELTGRATLLSAIDLYEKNIINKKRIVELIHPYHLRQIFSERIDEASFKTLRSFSEGLSILPRSAVSAKAYFSAPAALEAKKRGEKVCFCKKHFIPSDTIVMSEMDAILCLNPVAIHVVTACRGYGIPAFLNLENYNIKLIDNNLINTNKQIIHEGDWVTLSSKKQILFQGKANYSPARFQKYLDGDEFKMEQKEKRVFIKMSKAFSKYQKIINSLDVGEIVNINELIKYIRNNIKNDIDKSKILVNSWFDNYTEHYLKQILECEMGSHQDQSELYNLLSVDRKVLFFKKIINLCIKKDLKGFRAGSFMLGRFVCLPLPCKFWKELNYKEIAFLLNETILFEKYLQVLYEVGEQHVTRAKNTILNQGLGEIKLNNANAKIFISLKLLSPDWYEIKNALPKDHDTDTKTLISLLIKPFGTFYDYKAPWSIGKLKKICQEEKLALPEENQI
ncbi:MAG: hypothetical protein IMY72_02395 [Bacteroidetes bacterium]|nr:hypothetical protein [Bacteroidota bacterium]